MIFFRDASRETAAVVEFVIIFHEIYCCSYCITKIKKYRKIAYRLAIFDVNI